jgi:hypothetical protein
LNEGQINKKMKVKWHRTALVFKVWSSEKFSTRGKEERRRGPLRFWG